ncbi:MAG: DNA-binding response regulator [Caulobacter sp.]|nr:DNA-binding response regulator [Caulobacter sp.]
MCLLGAVAVVAAINTVNVFTWLHDEPGGSVRTIVITETCSGVTALALLWMPWLAIRHLPLDRRPLWRTLSIHLAILVAFGIVHVAGFVALRHLVFAAFGEGYYWGRWQDKFPYELRKDGLHYVMIMVCFWLVRERLVSRATSTPQTGPAATFDIRDGARLVRAPVADILAISSAGNYAEFHLADGRKPLMRASLASLEKRLGDHGFVRTHRSWLVNAARVTELTPEGSGDYAITLGGVRAPLSRRFPEALAKLRGG